MKSYQNKVFITGAGSGIGKATAQLFIKKGWFVAASDIDLEKLHYLKEEGVDQCFLAEMDVSNVDQVKEVFARYKAEHEYLNILVNNAGILQMGLFENIALEDHLKTIQVNFSGLVSCSYIALDLLRGSNNARIINISSSSAVYGIPDFSVYSSTKNAVSALTEALNIELKKDKIYVCDIRPLFVSTPMLSASTLNGKPYQGKTMQLVKGRLSPEDVAETVWKAARQKKLHWSIGVNHKLMNLSLALMPFAKHAIFSRSMPDK